jgi:hypothetical protein
MSASGAKQAWFKVGQSADELGPQAKDGFIILPTPLLQRMFATILTTWKKRPSRCVNDLPASVTHAAAARTKEGHTMEALRDIVVVLDDSARSEIRLNIAVALAQQHDAHLTGLSALDLFSLHPSC